MIRNILILFLAVFSFSELTSCAMQNKHQSNIPNTPLLLANDTALWQKKPTDIWDSLEHTGLTKLKSQLASTTNPDNSAWLKLTIISKQNSVDTSDLVNQLMAWRKDYPNHPGNALFPDNATLTSLLNTAYPQQIALLLPLSGPLSTQGQMVRDGFLSAYNESLAKNHLSQTVSFYDTAHSDISALYQEA
jgi:outer membrane PBP1 activator LpoA protein